MAITSDTQFQPLSIHSLAEILGLTIKQDEQNKVVTFLCELSAYTDNAQFNISYNAPSSTGKSFIPLQIASLFPDEDVIKLGNCSPTAFFHEQGDYNKETNVITVDLSRKILIFLDQPHNLLLERLRSLLSHDQKQMTSKITDKNQRGGNRTKTVIINGYPAVIFCTAGLKIDEQEGTRFLLLSPEVSQDKIRQGVQEKVRKEADNDSYKSWLDGNLNRHLLKARIQAIKEVGIEEIRLTEPEKISERYLKQRKFLKPRHQRDVGRLLAIIKALTLLNFWWRERDKFTITANKDDVEEGFALWDKISESQELNLPPYIYKLYHEVIIPAWETKQALGEGLTRQDVSQKHYEVYGRMVDSQQLRQQILPMLETAGLITQEPDPSDKRKLLIYPTTTTTIPEPQNNSGSKGGVSNEIASHELVGEDIPF